MLPFYKASAADKEDLPIAIKNLQEFILLEAESENSEIKNREKPSIDYKSSWLAKVLLLGHGKALKSKIQEILDKLILEDDTIENYTIFISANPLPNIAVIDMEQIAKAQDNESINIKNTTILIHLGLLSWIENEDSLAYMIAHEMTHANLKHRKMLRDSGEINKILDSLPGYSELDSEQIEEIRADLGGLERVIKAGYNPWGFHNFYNRLAKFKKNIGFHFFKSLYSKKDFDYITSHPIDEIRIAAGKAFILDRGLKQDLSQHTNQFTQLPMSIQRLRKKIQIYNSPLISPSTQKGLLALIFYQAFIVSGALDEAFIFSGLTNEALIPTWEQIIAELASTLSESNNSVAHASYSAWSNAIRTVVKIVFIAGSSAFAALFLTALVYVIHEHIRESYQPRPRHYVKLLKLRKINLSISKSLEITLINSETPIEDMTLLEIMEENISALKIIEELYMESPQLRLGYSLERFRKKTLDLQVNLLDRFKKKLDKLSLDEKKSLLDKFKIHLDLTPAFVYEHKTVLNKAKRIIDLNGESISEIAFNPIQMDTESLFQYRIRLILMSDQEYYKNLSPLENLQLVAALNDQGLRTSAAEVLQMNYTSIVDFVFSKSNNEIKLSLLLSELHKMLKRKGTLNPLSEMKTFFLDKKIALELKMDKNIQNKIGIISLWNTVPPTGNYSDNYRKIYLKNNDSIKDFFKNEFNSLEEMTQFIHSELKPKNVILNALKNNFYQVIIETPKLIKGSQDISTLLDNEFFWPAFQEKKVTNLIDQIFLDSISSLIEEHPQIWKYDINSSEKYHALIVSKLKEFDEFPKDFNSLFDLWKRLTRRGVTSVSDDLFQKLYLNASKQERKLLEKEALEGKIWARELKVEIANRRILESKQYLDLLQSLFSREERLKLLDDVIKNVQDIYPERGIHYMNLLERISMAINSTAEESTLIQIAKTIKTGHRAKDLGLRILSALTEEALSWSQSEQWELILFLRGDIEPTKKIEAFSSIMGSKRLQRMYQLLPELIKTGFIDIFLSSSRGLIPQVTPTMGYSKTIINYILKDVDDTSRKVANQILEAFLYSLKKTGNIALQSFVLAYLLSLDKSKMQSNGEVLKNIFEIFGTTGIKIGQFLVASGILPEEDTVVLRQLQEKTKIPERKTIYQDIQNQLHGKLLPVRIKQLLGAASLKYTVLAEENKTQDPLVIKVMRLDAIAHTNAEFLQLDAMANYLTKKYGTKYGIFSSIVAASKEAVGRELSLTNEMTRSKIARHEVYNKFDEVDIKIKVPREAVLKNRLSSSEFAEGVSFFDLSDLEKKRVAQKILSMEREILFSEKKMIIFDPDRHPGNFRISVIKNSNDNTFKLKIFPIDFGQLTEISWKQRERLIELFSLSEIFKK